jgi:hypothetical protein
VPERKNWDKGEWEEKARDKDREARAFAQARDKAMREGEYCDGPSGGSALVGRSGHVGRHAFHRCSHEEGHSYQSDNGS